ncbi:MAG: CHAT domain-containing protein [Ktedonobacteraceae bacterium]
MTMDIDHLLQQLRDLSLEEGRQLLLDYAAALDDHAAFGILLADEALKELYTPFLSLKLAELLTFFGDHIQHLSSHALGLKAKGDAFVQIGHFQAAIECLDAAGKEFLRLGDEGNWARSRISWITANEALGNVETALREARRARDVFQRLGEYYWACNIDVNTAVIFDHMGRYQDAIRLYENARATYLTLVAQPPDDIKRAIAIAEANQAISFCWLGRFAEAFQLQQQAYASFASLGNTELNVFIEIDMANIDHVQGYFGQAFLRYLHARDALVQNDAGTPTNPMLLADLKLWMAACLIKLSRSQEACQLVEEAVATYKHSGTSLQTSNALREYATTLRATGRLREALAALEEALTLFHHGGFDHYVSATKLQQAEVLLELGATTEAYHLASLVKEQADTQNFATRSIRASLVMADSLLTQAQDIHTNEERAFFVERATFLCKQAALQAKQYHLQEEVYKNQYLLGRIFALQGNGSKAARHYAAAIIQIERILNNLAFDLSPSFLRSAWDVYENMIALCYQQSHIERAFSYLERARSVALHQYLTKAKAGQSPTSEQEPITRAPGSQANQLTLLRQQYELREWQEKYHSYSALAANIDPSVYSLVQQEIMQTEIRRCETKISELFELLHLSQSAASPIMGKRKSKADRFEQLDIARLRQSLAPDQLVLAYFLHKGKLIIFALTAENLTAYEIPDGGARLEQFLPQLHARLHPGGWSNVQSPPHEGIRRLLKKLYDLLIAPVEALLPTPPGHITIVPYGPLHKLPFHALYDGSHFLIENFQINHLPASNLLAHFNQRQKKAVADSMVAPSPDSIPLIFGYSGNGHLQRCIDEAKTLAATLHGRCYLEEQATIAQLIEQAPGSPIIHIATHGHARSDAPNFSFVQMADGQLNAIDAFSLDLRDCELVTLSGCETGLSLSGGGDEQLGLGRAFLAAGTRSLLLSLWPVEDHATNEFMQIFYQRLLRGESKMQALRDAQCSLLTSESADYSHPYFWAAFRLIGDPSPLISCTGRPTTVESTPQKSDAPAFSQQNATATLVTRQARAI